MPLFPLSRPLQGAGLLTCATRLYFKSILQLLPLSILIVGLFYIIRFGQPYVPKQWQHLFSQVAMFACVFTVPLCASLIGIQNRVATEPPAPRLSIFILICRSFLSLFGCLISMLLFPMIILAACFAISFALDFYAPFLKNLPLLQIQFAWQQLIPIVVFASFVSKIFAPVLVVIQNEDSNTAIDHSEFLVKGYFFRTFIYGLLMVELLNLFSQLPTLMRFYYPDGAKQLLPQALEAIAQGLLILVIPWISAVLLTQCYDLKRRKAVKKTNPAKVAKKPPPTKTATTSEVSF